MDAWARSVQLSPGTAAAICSLAAKEMDNQHTASICGCAAIFHSNVDMSSSFILIFKDLQVCLLCKFGVKLSCVCLMFAYRKK